MKSKLILIKFAASKNLPGIILPAVSTPTEVKTFLGTWYCSVLNPTFSFES